MEHVGRYYIHGAYYGPNKALFLGERVVWGGVPLDFDESVPSC